MKKTVIIITAVALLLSGVQSGAKSKTLGAFIEKVNSSLVSFDYSFSMQTPASKSKMTGKGKVKIQGSSFFLEGNGLEVWCDGASPKRPLSRVSRNLRMVLRPIPPS